MLHVMLLFLEQDDGTLKIITFLQPFEQKSG
jgi:hypothetical protein